MEQTRFTLTLIAGRPAVGACELAAIIGATAALLKAQAAELQLPGPEWGVSGALAGFSEYADNLRLALEFCAAGDATRILPAAFAQLEGLRSYRYAESAASNAFIAAAAELARPLADGALQELWLSQAGETPVFITADTALHAAELLAGRAAG